MKKCPICDSTMNEVQELKGKLNTANVVSSLEDKVNRTNLMIYKCPKCNHGVIDNFLDDEFYTDFSVALGDDIDEAAVNQRSQKFDSMIEFLAEKSPNCDGIIEIGSGCGYLLNAAKKKFVRVLGVEPSKTEYDISVKVAPNCEIINDFFGSNLDINENFSAFIATMVFEHIPDVVDAMKYVYDLLIDGGVGFITVPNGQRAFRGGCYFDIYPQHLHYYNVISLSKLASVAGFEVVFVRESENKDYLEMLVRKTKLKYADDFLARLEMDKAELCNKVMSHKSVSIWGASYVARSCVEFFKPSMLKHLFDVSNIKIGKYIADFSLKIEYPTKESVNENDLIIIMANEYTGDVMKTLKNYRYKGDIIGFDSDGFLSELKIN